MSQQPAPGLAAIHAQIGVCNELQARMDQLLADWRQLLRDQAAARTGSPGTDTSE
ncbi:hypothetical protein [Streptomyces sp. WM6373]|uniref:hypothetical protein n=1 Tax=Streptomyces sp. WM6373 TaxID=1415556 RepID=UPI000AAB174A|nr:hypothetical protein [Streptomyces sp. WM6373]